MTTAPTLPADLRFDGRGLSRPECVLCTADGSRFTADWRGGVYHSHPEGSDQLYLATDTPAPLRPNGIALTREGDFLVADLGELGGVWRLGREGRATPFLVEVENQPLPPCNFVLQDRFGRTWITVSTRQQPRQRAQRPDVADGFIICVDHRGARIVADKLGYANEVLLDAEGDWLYVNETCARRLSRFRVTADGHLGPRETVTRFGHGTFPDGLAADESGGLWVVSIVSNRVFRLDPGGECTTLVEDADAVHLDWVETAFQNGSMDVSHFSTVRSRCLRNVSSVAFGGKDRQQVWLGCLSGDALATFRSPWPGIEPAHWHWAR